MGIPQNERESPRIEPPPPTSTDRTQNYFRRKSTAVTDFTKRLWRALVRGYMLGRETDPWNARRTFTSNGQIAVPHENSQAARSEAGRRSGL